MFFENAAKMSEELLPYMTEIRRNVHKNPGVGFDNEDTVSYIEKELSDLGITPKRCGKCGLTATIGQGSRCIMLRADTDGLPFREESGLEFACKNGRMHGCGHDMHTAMLLGAAAVLKKHENELDVCVKLMFQSAEETLEGAKDMIASGALMNPEVNAAMTVHVMTGTAIKTGNVIVPSPGTAAPAADFFEITVNGKGCHGSAPSTGTDPIYAGANIVTALSVINSRELAASERAVLTLGSFCAGDAANVIPSSAVLKGSFRCWDDGVRSRVRVRLCDISADIAGAFGAEASVDFTSGCPLLYNSEELCGMLFESLRGMLGDDSVISAAELKGNSPEVSGSEDFSYISQEVPSVMAVIAAGNTADGHVHPLHSPRVTFDERALSTGCAAYCAAVAAFMKNQTPISFNDSKRKKEKQ